MKGNMEERAERLALYILENQATVRSAAQKFGISKSSVHKDLAERLAERHIRGGIATRKKYKGT